jgi:hypothetical protein
VEGNDEDLKQTRKRRSKKILPKGGDVFGPTAADNMTVENKPKHKRRKAEGIKSNARTRIDLQLKLTSITSFLRNIQRPRVV